MRERFKNYLLVLIWAGFISINILVFVVGGPQVVEHMMNPPEAGSEVSRKGWQNDGVDKESLAQYNLTEVWYTVYVLSFDVILTLVFLIAGSILYFHSERNRLMIIVGLLLVTFPVSQITVAFPLDSSINDAGFFDISLGTFAVDASEIYTIWASATIWLIFPNNKFSPKWTRFVLPIWTLVAVAWLFFPKLPYNIAYGDTWNKTIVMSSLVSLFIYASVMVLQIYRYFFISERPERQQSKWVLVGFTCLFIAGVIRYAPGGLQDMGLFGILIGQPILTVLSLAFALSFIFAVTRRGLWQVDTLISRSLTSLSLLLSVSIIYAVLIGIFTSSISEPDVLIPSIIATSIVALMFRTLYTFFRRFFNRLLYGYPNELDEIIINLSAGIAQTANLNELPVTVVDLFRESIALEYVALIEPGEQSIETNSRAPQSEQLLIFPLETIMYTNLEMVVGSKHKSEPFSPREISFLQSMINHITPALSAYMLEKKLSTSLQETAIEREDVLSRVGRNIHDHISNPLGEVVRQLCKILQVSEENSDEYQELEKYYQTLEETQRFAREMSHDIYNADVLLYDVSDALRDLASKYHNPSSGLTIHFSEPPPLPDLPHAHSLFIYRVTSNGLDNVSKHAINVTNCRLEFKLIRPHKDEYKLLFKQGVNTRAVSYLHITIDDDGDSSGIDFEKINGNSFASLRKAAFSLRGTCFIQRSSRYGGTQLVAYLPIPEKIGSDHE